MWKEKEGIILLTFQHPDCRAKVNSLCAYVNHCPHQNKPIFPHPLPVMFILAIWAYP